MVFVGIGSLLAQIVVYFSMGNIKMDSNILIIVWVICVLICLPVVGFMFFVIGLGIFHLVLKCKGKTTREYLKKKADDGIKDKGYGGRNDWFSTTPSFLDYEFAVTKKQ